MAFLTIDAGLSQVRKHESTLLMLGHSALNTVGAPLYTIDFYAIGAIKRALAVTTGFCTLIEDRNLVCAGALIRMQVETAFRFYGISLVADPGDAVLQIMGGVHLKKMKARDGKPLTDTYLAREISKHRPWVEPLFRETSNFVHFTEKQIFAGLIDVNDDDRAFRMLISSDDSHAPESVFVEALEAFDSATLLVAEVIETWFAQRGRASQV